MTNNNIKSANPHKGSIIGRAVMLGSIFGITIGATLVAFNFSMIWLMICPLLGIGIAILAAYQI